MNAVINQTQSWFRAICDKTTKIKRKSKHKNSKSREHKDAYGTVVLEYEFNNPDIDEANH